jgi:predicted transcriptional regulator
VYKLSVNKLQTIGFILGETFGNLLEGWRKSAGISQSELARRLNLSPTYISQLERDYYPNSKSGKGRPSEACTRINLLPSY